MGPHILRRLARALGDIEAGTLNESLAIQLDAGRQGEAVWTVGRKMTEKINLLRRKRA